jgi:hypothetical protein
VRQVAPLSRRQPWQVDAGRQTRAHPLLAELRGMRSLLAALLRQLDLPELQADGAWRSPSSIRKRDAALSRWNRVRRDDGAA